MRERVSIAEGIGERDDEPGRGLAVRAARAEYRTSDMTARLLAAQMNDSKGSRIGQPRSAPVPHMRPICGRTAGARGGERVEFLMLDRYFPSQHLLLGRDGGGVSGCPRSAAESEPVAVRRRNGSWAGARARLEYETIVEIIRTSPDSARGHSNGHVSTQVHRDRDTYFQSEATLASRRSDDVVTTTGGL